MLRARIGVSILRRVYQPQHAHPLFSYSRPLFHQQRSTYATSATEESEDASSSSPSSARKGSSSPTPTPDQDMKGATSSPFQTTATQLPFYTPPAGKSQPFRLTKGFIDKFKVKQPPFGFGVLGELVYRRTYSRVKTDGTNEQWFETVERVVNGTYNMQKRWIEQHGLGWNANKAQLSAQDMYARIFEMKFLPPGRGLWAMGSALTEQKGLYAALNNCAFVSTENLKEAPSKPFVFLMDAAMLGVGVGFDTRGAGSVVVKGPKSVGEKHVVHDSREGWVESVRLLLDAHFNRTPEPVFDYSAIRPAGSPIKGFGGSSSGPQSLQQLHEAIGATLVREKGDKGISITAIVDIMNHIGRCVVSANTRQTAEIAFGDPNSDEYIDLKNYAVNPHRAEYGWTSNNSVFATLGMDYSKVSSRVASNGEPGFAWLENMRDYSRMKDTEHDFKDTRAKGGNPCLEQTLESYEMCCLVETFPNNHENIEDFKKTLKYAYLYAKTVTLGATHWPDTNKVMLRNRRIGCSMSGIAQFITKRGLNELKQWSSEGYAYVQYIDRQYADWLAIPRSIKTTSIKPSGTVSLLAGATPGMHYPLAEYYIRRIRLGKDSPLLTPLQRAGYRTEIAAENKKNMVVEIPICAGSGIRKAQDISMWEQLSLAAFLQKYWADNQVSSTVTFDPVSEGKHIPHALNYYQYQLKGVSFLPFSADTYPQMPYEEITEDQYHSRLSEIQPVDWTTVQEATQPAPDKFCDSTSCVINNPDPSSTSAFSSPSSPSATVSPPNDEASR